MYISSNRLLSLPRPWSESSALVFPVRFLEVHGPARVGDALRSEHIEVSSRCLSPWIVSITCGKYYLTTLEM